MKSNSTKKESIIINKYKNKIYSTEVLHMTHYDKMSNEDRWLFFKSYKFNPKDNFYYLKDFNTVKLIKNSFVVKK